MPSPAPPAYAGYNGGYYFGQGTPIASVFDAKKEHRKKRNSENTNRKLMGWPSWTANDEEDLVQWCNNMNSVAGENWNYPTLDVEALPDETLHKMPPFKINYQKWDEIRLRLANTIIGVKGHPFYVISTRPKDEDFQLMVKGAEDKTYVVLFSEIKDLRPIPPGYIKHGKEVGLLTRHPEKIFQQGLNRSNGFVRRLGSEEVAVPFQGWDLLPALKGRKSVRRWTEPLAEHISEGLISAVRLSNNLAAMPWPQETGGKLDTKIFYRGREMGKVIGDEILLLDEDDAVQPWLGREVKKVGLQFASV